MNEHDATEIAFKNGYKEAAREIFEEIKYNSKIIFDGAVRIVALRETDFEAIKKKYTEGSER